MIASLLTHIFRYKIIRYLISGGTGAFIHIGTVYILHDHYEMWWLTATTIGFLLAVGISFAMQKFFTFQDMRLQVVRSQSFIFFIVASTNLCLNYTFMYLLVERAQIPATIAQICSALILAVSSFFLYSQLFKSAASLAAQSRINTETDTTQQKS